MKKNILILSLFLLLVACTNKNIDPIIIEETIVIKDTTKRVSMIMFGDALIHGTVYRDSLNRGSYLPMFDNFKSDIESSDIAYYNQETIIGCDYMPFSPYPTFNTPQSFGKDMVDLGFNLVSTANNHSYDMGEKGLLCSIDFWDSLDVEYAGTYNSEDKRNNESVFTINGIDFGFLSYTYGTNGLNPPKDKSYYINYIDKDLIIKDINNIKDNVDFLMVAMHFGDEYSFNENQTQRELSRLMVDNGVDLIIGSHPHVIQPIEWINDSLVIYSLGNMISAQEGIERLSGLSVKLEFVLNGQDKSIENVEPKLIYTDFEGYYTNFKLHYYDDIDDTYINNYQDHKDMLESVVFKYLK